MTVWPLVWGPLVVLSAGYPVRQALRRTGVGICLPNRERTRMRACLGARQSVMEITETTSVIWPEPGRCMRVAAIL